MRSSRRAAVLAASATTVLGLGLLAAGPASAHIAVDAPNATQGGYSTITFRVPTESDTASTVGLAVQLPTDTPIASVAVQPKTGWTFTEKKAKPTTPLSDDDGSVNSVVTEIDWKASAGTGIKPGEFDTFSISAGPLPKTSTLTFKAIQTYSDGSTVSWIEVPAPGSSAEPQHPAPMVSLAPAAADPATSVTSSAAAGSGVATDAGAFSGSGSGPAAAESSGHTASNSNTVAEVALVIGIIGLLTGGGALAALIATRRRLGA